MNRLNWFFIFSLFLVACEKDEPLPQDSIKVFSDFTSNAEGWQGDFADYPVGEENFYELAFEHSKLPLPLDQNQYSLKLSGSNRSDDLFMFLKKEVTNLPPNQSFEVTFNLALASIYPTNSIGIGGPPAESVYIKVGVTQEEPQKYNDGNDFYLLNIDKGNQSEAGNDAQVIGHVGVEDDTQEYTLITRDNSAAPFTFQTNDEGSAWLIIGTDSGYEGITTLYYNSIEVIFKPKGN